MCVCAQCCDRSSGTDLPSNVSLKYELTHADGWKASHTRKHTDQEGTLGVEGVRSTHVDASVAQKLQQADVVVAVDLQGETNTQK